MRCRLCSRTSVVRGYCSVHTGRRCACGLTYNKHTCTVCSKVQGQVKTHEMHVKRALEEDAALDGFIHNKRISGTRISPDFLWRGHSHALVLEVDEHGHRGYDPHEEYKRMKDVSRALCGRVVFVRLHVPCESSTVDCCMTVLRHHLEDADASPELMEGIAVLNFFNGEELV